MALTLRSVKGTALSQAEHDANHLEAWAPRTRWVMNGSMQVAQDATRTLSTAAQYGSVDGWACWGTGTAVSAGTIGQSTVSTIGTSGYSLLLSGVTITGAGVVLMRHRIESKNAVRLKNQTVSFAAKVLQDTGGSINYTIVVRKPTASDNYASTTVIGTSSAQAVASGTGTAISYANLTLGDCSFGLEIEVQAVCGAVTTKNFSMTEAALDVSTTVLAFGFTPFEDEERRCQRYFCKSFPYATAPAQNAGTTGSINVRCGSGASVASFLHQATQFPVTMRTTPTVTLYNPSAANAQIRDITANVDMTATTVVLAGDRTFGVSFTGNASTTSASQIAIHYTADARL